MYGEEKEKYNSPNLPNTPKGVVLLTTLSHASRSDPGRMAKGEGFFFLTEHPGKSRDAWGNVDSSGFYPCS